MNKSFRQNQILKLIRRKRIHTQEELARELAAMKIRATQVTLSRDIKELGLAKTGDGYVVVEQATPKAPDFPTVAREFIDDIRVARNLVVLKTLPGNASAVAAAFDSEKWDEAIGTLAGDDTIFIATGGDAIASRLAARVRRMLAGT